MFRPLRRLVYIAHQRMNTQKELREQFFRSYVMSNSEMVDVCKHISGLGINEIRQGLGKEEYLKNFMMALIQKIPNMDTNDVVSIMRDLLRNPDFRDMRNTYSLWPHTCRNLIFRTESFSLAQVADVLNSLCFIRITSGLFESLIDGIKEKLANFTAKDFANLPLSRYQNFLWALNQQRIDIQVLYQNLYHGLVNHRDFEYTSLDQLAMILSSLSMNNYIQNPEILTRGIMEIIKSSLEENKIKSFPEMLDVIFYISQIKFISDKFHEVMNKVLILRKDEITNVQNLNRLLTSNLKFTHELKEIIVYKILENLNHMNFSEIITVYQSQVFDGFNEQKKEILKHLKHKTLNLEISTITFSKIEKVINHVYNMDISEIRELLFILEPALIEIFEHKAITDSMLLRTMKLVVKIKAKSRLTQIFKERIINKQFLPNFHTRDVMILSILIANLDELQTPDLLELIDNKLFSNSHLYDYSEMAISLYYLSRINKVGIETQELLTKRVLDKDLKAADIDHFSLNLVSNILNNSQEYIRRNLPIIKVLVSFKKIQPSILKLGDILKKEVSDFDISYITLIRCLWVLSYLDLKDSRLFNSSLISKIKEINPKIEMVQEKLNMDEKAMDSFHLSILIQSLGILGNDNPDCMDYMRKLVSFLENYNISFEPTQIDVPDLENICRELKLNLKKNVNIYANKIPYVIDGKPLLFYNDSYYRYESDDEKVGKSFDKLHGFFLMRKKFWDSMMVKYFEINHKEWSSFSYEHKKKIIQSFFR